MDERNGNRCLTQHVICNAAEKHPPPARVGVCRHDQELDRIIADHVGDCLPWLSDVDVETWSLEPIGWSKVAGDFAQIPPRLRHHCVEGNHIPCRRASRWK